MSEHLSEAQVEEALKPIDDGVIRILTANHKEFRKFLAKRVGSEALADDLLQQCFVKAVNHPPKADQAVGVLAWFYQVLRNALIDHYRSQASYEKALGTFVRELKTDGPSHSPAADEWVNELCKCLDGLLPTLKPEYAAILKQVDLNGESPALVAERMGMTLNNVNVRLHRARIALKKSLERTCGTCTEHGCLSCTCGSEP